MCRPSFLFFSLPQRTPLHCARDAEVSLALLREGADVNAVDRFRRTPLHVATDENKVRVLVARGANVNARDFQGHTPLDAASGVERAQVGRVFALWIRKRTHTSA